MSLPPINRSWGGGTGSLYNSAGGNIPSAKSAYYFNDSQQQASTPSFVIYCNPEPVHSPLNNLLSGTNQVVNALVHLFGGALGLLTAVFLSNKLKPLKL